MIDTFLTLDFELFLGAQSGTIENCLIRPMEQLDRIAKKHNAKFTIFVDTAYLIRLDNFSDSDSDKNLWHDYTTIVRELKSLSDKGHDIQLHIHPQWLYSNYVNGRWEIDQKHYKLSDITEHEAQKAFRDGCELIQKITGKRPIAFRAGGFSAQPTSLLKKLFEENEIYIDSSVYPGNVYHSLQQKYDYSNAPHGTIYHFEDDICVPTHALRGTRNAWDTQRVGHATRGTRNAWDTQRVGHATRGTL